QLVVLGHTVGAAGGAGLDLAGVQGHGDVGNGGVLGLAGAVGHDGGVAGPVGHLDGVQGLGQGADLVDLDEDGVAHLLLNAGGQALHVGDEQVVAHQLHPVADGAGQHGPALPVGLGHAVLQGDDGIVVGKLLPHVHQLLLGQLLAGLGLDIELLLLVPPLGRGGVNGDLEVLAGLVAGLLDGLHDDLQGVLILLQVGGIAALVAHAGGGSAVLLQGGLQLMEDLGAHP
ncbi:tRNA (N6-threonylcarbamoyladenosine(37)-N6)-methyltransferase TrmO, partial [Dysosmobacter welbionis]